MSKFKYYLLSLTWGILMSIVGYLVAAILMLFGCKPKKWGHGYYFVVGNYWGGVNLGPIFLCSRASNTDFVREHEYGHGIQNCYYGPFYIILVAIPSMIRCKYRDIRFRMGKDNPTDYYAIWFEKQASDLGLKYSGQE